MWRRFNDLGMLGVLVVLCALFSVLTIRDLAPNDAGAARRLGQEILGLQNHPQRVVIAVRAQSEDELFAAALEETLKSGGANVVAIIKGEPSDARAALEKIASDGGKLDVVACNPFTAPWLIFADLQTDFPGLGDPVLVASKSERSSAFLQPQNLLNVTNQIAVIAILAIGMTLVIICGGIDLSVGSLIALAAVTATLIIRDLFGGTEASTGSMVLACLGAVGLCALVGWMTGAVVTVFRVPAFIVTLGMMLVARGVAGRATEHQSVYEVPESFIWLGRGADLFGIPNAVVLMLALYVGAHWFMRHTALGRHLYAVGGNADAALVSGLPVGRITRFAYTISAALAGLGGVVMASNLKSGSANYGQTYELYVIAAVVVGGASLSGGQGQVFGTLVGALIIAVIQNGMNLLNVDVDTQNVVLGLVLLGAVLVDRLKHRRG